VSHGYDVHEFCGVEIDNVERETAEDKAPGAVKVFGPAMWSVADAFNRIENGDDEICAGLGAPLRVPLVSAFDFQP